MKTSTLVDRFETDFDHDYNRPPWHVFERMSPLIADGEALDYVDYRLDISEGVLNGAVVVVTTNLIVQATLTQTPGHVDSDGPSTVHVVVWPRRALERLAIHADADGHANTDATWSVSWGELWPKGAAAITLHFSGDIDPLRLPLAENTQKKHRTALRALVPALAADLV